MMIAHGHMTGAAAQGQGLTRPVLSLLTEEKQLARAEELRLLGDIAGARLVLEHILEAGSAAVAFRLAETYDPGRLSAWGVVGLRGDPKKARELYERALSGGMKEAQERLASLPR
jgi:TPR repeat protein